VCDKASFSFKATTRKKKKKQQKGRDDGVGSKEGVECTNVELTVSSELTVSFAVL
jgi:hypothetical protein